MPPRKRARRSSPGSSSTSASDAAPLVELDGGEPFPSKVISKWRRGHSDITVKVQGTDFAAHKLVLDASSTYFEGLFQSERSDANAPALAEVPAAVFEPLLQFLYEGRCSCDQGLLTPLLRAASYLGVKPLELSIGTALQARLLPSNAFTLWTLAEEAVLPLLEEAAKSLALEKFEELGDTVSEASWDQVHALVASDQLAARSEEAVFEAVVRYAEAQRPEEERLLALMRHVRFPLMRREFMEQTVKPWPMLNTLAGRNLLLEALMPAFGFGGGCAPRVGLGPRLLYVMGGCTGRDSLASVETVDPQTNSWTEGTPLLAARHYTAAAALQGKIYLLGGTGASSKVEAFDPQAGAWSEVAPMPTGRLYPAAAAIDGRLFAIGGSDGRYLNTVDAFDPQTGVWTAVAPMPTARHLARTAVLDGKIYVVGGCGGTRHVATVEVYDPATNAWSQAPPMSAARVALEVTALGGKLYAAGGDSGNGILSSVEVFDPQTNAWTPLAPMSTARTGFAMVAMQGKLYVAGGYDGTSRLAAAETYDPQQNRWEAVAPMAVARCHGASVAM